MLFSCVLLIRAVVSFTSHYSHRSRNLRRYEPWWGQCWFHHIKYIYKNTNMLSWLGLSVSQHEVVCPREGMCWKEHGESRTRLISRAQSWLNMQDPFCQTFPQEMDQKLLLQTCEEGCFLKDVLSVYTKSAGQKIKLCYKWRIKLLSHTRLKFPSLRFLFTLPLDFHHLILNSSEKRYSLWIETEI